MADAHSSRYRDRTGSHFGSDEIERESASFADELAAIDIATASVCGAHTAPLRWLAEIHIRRPPLSLVLGPRGGGKSYLSALDTHLNSRSNPGHATRILGGSKAQSEQIHRALVDVVQLGNDEKVIRRLLKEEASYTNGSEVRILAASSTSVRGPHVPSLKLDEVDEIDPERREAALGMCMNRKGQSASVMMTSTWHRVGGPMSQLLERGRAGEFPVYEFCIFEVLEKCPEERSGRFLEKCADCPLVTWCHSDLGTHPSGLPKAKRSHGHYAIDALIQKIRGTSLRSFEADYLCLGPRADGVWFADFDPSAAASELAEYCQLLPVYVALDTGVFTAAVFMQVAGKGRDDEEVHVFADYLAENRTVEQNAFELLELARRRCGGRVEAYWYDPPSSARTAMGVSVRGELESAGIRPMHPWPTGSVADSLALLDSFVRPADGRSRLRIHPRCTSLIESFRNYRRARRSHQWMDYPEDPQHPHEDLIDALRGGLRALYPEGRTPRAPLPRISAKAVL